MEKVKKDWLQEINLQSLFLGGMVLCATCWLSKVESIPLTVNARTPVILWGGTLLVLVLSVGVTFMNIYDRILDIVGPLAILIALGIMGAVIYL